MMTNKSKHGTEEELDLISTVCGQREKSHLVLCHRTHVLSDYLMSGKVWNLFI